MLKSKNIELLKKQPRLGGITDDARNLSKAFVELADAIGKSKIVAINQEVAKSLQDIGDAATFFEQRLQALNQNFGITSAQAATLNQALEKQRAALNGTNTTFRATNLQVQQYASNLKKLLPLVDQANDKLAGSDIQKRLMQTQRVLKTNLGLTDEQTNSFTQFAEATKQGSAAQLRFAKRFAEAVDPKGTLGAFKMITSEIADAGAEIQVQYGRIPGSLEGAVMKSKKLGFNIQQVAKVGEKLLNIESSIGDELEFQLLSGRRLVNQQGESLTNQFRSATIQGDATKQAETLNEIIESQGDVLENNLFARRQLAKTLGIEENQLASALQKRKILERYEQKTGLTFNIDDEGALAQAASELKKTGAMNDKEFEEFQKATDLRTTDDLLRESLMVQREQLMLSSIQASFDENLRSKVLELSGAGGGGITVGSGLATTAAGSAMLVDSFTTALGKIATTTFSGATAKQESAVVVKAEDAYMSPLGAPGYQRVITGPQGSVAINDNDAVAVGTNLGGGSGNDNSDVVSAIMSLKDAILNQPAKSFNGGR
jgi:hypothetical protein